MRTVVPPTILLLLGGSARGLGLFDTFRFLPRTLWLRRLKDTLPSLDRATPHKGVLCRCRLDPVVPAVELSVHRGKFRLPANPSLKAEKSDKIRAKKQIPADLSVGRLAERVSYSTE